MFAAPNDVLRRYMQNMRLQASLEPIPYTGSIPLVPLNAPPGQLAHKKVSVIGCGQVGMAIAYAMLNQTTAGT